MIVKNAKNISFASLVLASVLNSQAFGSSPHTHEGDASAPTGCWGRFKAGLTSCFHKTERDLEFVAHEVSLAVNGLENTSTWFIGAVNSIDVSVATLKALGLQGVDFSAIDSPLEILDRVRDTVRAAQDEENSVALTASALSKGDMQLALPQLVQGLQHINSIPAVKSNKAANTTLLMLIGIAQLANLHYQDLPKTQTTPV